MPLIKTDGSIELKPRHFNISCSKCGGSNVTFIDNFHLSFVEPIAEVPYNYIEGKLSLFCHDCRIEEILLLF